MAQPRVSPPISQADEALAAGVLAGEIGPQDRLTRALRPLVEHSASGVAHPGDADDLAALSLYQILQAEERLLSSWDRRAPLNTYLAVAAARVCVDEHRRFQLLRRMGPDVQRPEIGPGHPSDSDLAGHLAGLPLPQVRDHLLSCARCARNLELAARALAASGGDA
ncbi:MAG: hypothetical protein GF320_00665 [Armatimonadia bacterium]|nr:hypothetical protein [Armatimonadia bacterium]